MSARETELPTWLAESLERPVAVLGRGSSGNAAAQLLASLGCDAEVYDERHELEDGRRFGPEQARRYGMVVTSPGFPAEHPWLKAARAAGAQVVPEIDLGACLWKGPLVLVTGTNGKTTLTEFLTAAFNSAGIEAFACGNIGRPFSSLVADGCNREAIAVCEASSFQAEISRRLSGDYLLWTNFDEDHLDRHGSMEAYFASKYKLARLLRGEVFLYDATVAAFGSEHGYALPPKGLVEEDADLQALGVAGTLFETPPESNTYLMARALWLRMGLDEGELIEAANNFQKSPHRMELICNRDGVSYWDDSKATNFHAVYGALKRFELPVVWIGGGKRKGGDIERFAKRAAASISSAHLIGETAETLAAAFKEQGVAAHVYESLDAAVAGASAAAESGTNILLSPGFASLDMFEGYSQRGEAFRRAISHLSVL